MNDDADVELVRRWMGLPPKSPPELLISVPLRRLCNLYSHSSDLLGLGRGLALSLGDGGRTWLTEMDRIGREIRCTFGELIEPTRRV